MKKYWRLKPRQIAIGLGVGLTLTNALVCLTHVTGWWPLTAGLLICLLVLPGFALLRLLQVPFKSFVVSLVFSFGLSVLVLMLSGLIANLVLPLFGVTQPLGLLGAIGAWNVMTGGLIIAAVRTNKKLIQCRRWSPKTVPITAWVFFAASLLLPIIATLGAIRLNNGGNALFAEFTIGLTAAVIIGAFLFRRRLPDELLAWLISSIGFTVLLMTSLRGWDAVGHDIEREFRVFTLTHIHGLWDISLDRDPYNACLSITILPEMFSQILGVSGLVVFKVVLQMIFAMCPVVIFLLLRKYTSKLGALVGSTLFICYPTFINDSAMLTRQGVAYLFFALALFIIAEHAHKRNFKILFLCCALGAVLSHYSTAYMFVALFVVAVIGKLFVAWLHNRPGKGHKKPRKKKVKKTVVSPMFAAMLFIMTFVWYSQITATSSGLIVTLQKSIANLPNLFSDDNKSADTATALLFAGGKTQVNLYESYLSTSWTETTKVASALTSDELPVTPLGQWAHSVGVSPSLITTLRQNFAKVLQLLALGSVVYMTYRLLRKKPSPVDHDYIYLSVAAVGILGLMVVLPVLSINYGVLRAFQQALIFLIVPITLLLATMSARLWPRLRTTLATGGIVFLFLLFTGLFAQLLGGVSPSLSLNNQGLYYGLFYTSKADAQAFAWLKHNVRRGEDVRAANFNRALMHDPQYPFARVGILPTQTGADTYIYTDPAQVLTQKIYLYYESSPLIMTFPLNYYDDNKNRIYSTATTRIYQ